MGDIPYRKWSVCTGTQTFLKEREACIGTQAFLKFVSLTPTTWTIAGGEAPRDAGQEIRR